MDEGALVRLLSGDGYYGFLLTAIPESGALGTTGSSFVALRLGDSTAVIDSHRHDAGKLHGSFGPCFTRE